MNERDKRIDRSGIESGRLLGKDQIDAMMENSEDDFEIVHGPLPIKAL